VLYGSQAPRRRDALRNREAIVHAASEAMTSDRPAVGMPEIARRAGVGQATLYRHFPDRYALTEAVITYQMDRLRACVAAHRERDGGFRLMLGEILDAQISMRPLVLLARRLEPAVRGRHERRMVALLTGPLHWAQTHGHVRGDLQPADLMLLITMVEGVLESAADVVAAGTAARRTIDLALNGVFRPAETPEAQTAAGSFAELNARPSSVTTADSKPSAASLTSQASAASPMASAAVA
jgi:AcrR family transcriptional regulator